MAEADIGPAPAEPSPAKLEEKGTALRSREELPPSDAAAYSSEDAIVTTARRAVPPPAAPPAEMRGLAAASAMARKSVAKSGGRIAWNACTVDDPGRSLSACRQMVDPAASGAEGRAAAHLADGLAFAWRGDFGRAIQGFDRAIEITPRSSFAYLNRGLAYRRSGQLDRAIADLDRAVRFAPASARAHYVRSLLLRQRGDTKRARADEGRAVDLDPGYEDLVTPGH